MTETVNPWLSHPVAVEAPPPAAAPEPPAPTGPTQPQHGIPAPAPELCLPVMPRSQQPHLWWLGAHGGAGESSLAHLLPGSAAADHRWPQAPGVQPARVVLVARSSMRGLQAAQATATQWAAGLVPGVDLIGLVVIADAPGRLPRPLREALHLVKGGVPRAWTIPWIESVRLGQPLTASGAPREVRQLVDELHALTTTGAAGAPT